jgi:predicted RNase H-like HicB family nuclease
MALDDYKVILYRNEPSGWVAEVPSIPGCYALMPTRAEALSELEGVFRMLEEKHPEKVTPLPSERTWSDFFDEGPIASETFMDNVEELPIQLREP